MSLLSNITSLFSPKKPSSDAPTSPHATPLTDRHANRVQKPRDKEAKTPSRRANIRSKRLAKASTLKKFETRDDDGLREEAAEFISQAQFASQAPPMTPVSSDSDFPSQIPMTSSNREPQDDDEQDIAVAPTISDVGEGDKDVHASGPGDDQEEQAEDEEEDEDERQYTFTGLLDHRWVGDQVQVQVQWYGADPTWEPESNIHLDAPETLFRYWQSRGGRPTNPRDPELFDILAIRDHSRNKRSLLVEWTGYPPSKNCWVPRTVVQKTAPSVVKEYWASLK